MKVFHNNLLQDSGKKQTNKQKHVYLTEKYYDTYARYCENCMTQNFINPVFYLIISGHVKHWVLCHVLYNML